MSGFCDLRWWDRITTRFRTHERQNTLSMVFLLSKVSPVLLGQRLSKNPSTDEMEISRARALILGESGHECRSAEVFETGCHVFSMVCGFFILRLRRGY